MMMMSQSATWDGILGTKEREREMWREKGREKKDINIKKILRRRYLATCPRGDKGANDN